MSVQLQNARIAINSLSIVSLTALGTISLLNLPSYAQTATFFCGTSKGIPVTYARTPRGNVPMIRWLDNSSFGGNWNRQRRCEDVSQRFQRNYDNGTLQTIATGTLNGYPVICAASSQDEPCTENTLLFTLKSGANASRVVQRLLDKRGLAAGTLVNQSACEGDCPTYINFETYLSNATPE
jgi:hypothetical protein